MTKPAQTLRIHTVHRGDGACLRSVAQYVWPLALAVVPASRACAPDHASRPAPAAEPARATHDTIAVDTATGAAGEHTTPPHRSRVRRHAAPKPLPPGAVTHDWAAFLGPTHNAVSSETHLLRDWPDTGPTLLWEMHAGTGYASPAVVGDRLVYFHRIGDVETIECLHPETGEYYWSYSYPATYTDRYGFNNGPRSSPVIAHDLVFTHGAAGVMHAVDLRTGNVVWRRDLSAEFNVPQNYFGVGSTPLVHGRLVIINVGGRRGDDDNAQPYPCVVALDTRTGHTVWAGGDQWGASYASPVPATIHGEDRIIVLAGGDSRPPTGGLLSLDPATGHIDWRFPFRSRKYESVNAATPVVVGHQVFVSSAYRTGGSLIDIRPDGTHAIAWNTNALRCHFGTPVHHDGYLYGFDGSGKGNTALVCVELATGRQVWRMHPEWEETIQQNGKPRTVTLGVFRGSLLRVDEHFLCLGEMGHLLWVDLTPDGYKELKRTRLFLADETWALPVLSRGLLYVCQHTRDSLTGQGPRLLCYDLRGEK